MKLLISSKIPYFCYLSFFFCRQFIKASISLTIVMGIGWLANVLFFTDKLLFIAYIMTVFIAGQGIIIFILYVPLSKHVSLIIVSSRYECHTYKHTHIHTHIQVREACSKWRYNKKRNSKFFNKIYFTNATSLQTSVSYSYVITLNMLISYRVMLNSLKDHFLLLITLDNIL